jgi:hypothetical protein
MFGGASMTRWDLSNETMLERFIAHVGALRLSGKRPIFEFVPESRSLDQNEMIHALYKQIAEQKQDESFKDIRRHCKLHSGVPILRRDQQEFRNFYDTALKRLDYEFKLESMDFVPVTSRMNKKQASEYIEEVIREYSQQGLCLLHPSEMQA